MWVDARAAAAAGGFAIALFGSAVPSISQSDVTATGTGFYVNADGWLLTNAHVVEDCAMVSVAGGGAVIDTKIDTQNDLAAIKVSDDAPSRGLELRATPARLGEDIVAFGYPLSSILSSSVKVTKGNVNSLLGMSDDTRFIQISSPIQPGNSGGPVVDMTGLVIGITTATLKSGATSDAGVVPQNVNFAIRTSVLQTFLESRGITFNVRPAAAPAAASTADLAEQVVSSVAQVLCHGGSPEAATNPSTTSPPETTRNFETVDNLDVVGFDYALQRGLSAAECTSTCQADQSCKAITYNKRQHVCFLKSDAKIAVRNLDALTAVVNELSPTVAVSTFVITAGHDMRGGDYRHFKTDFLQCYAACELEQQCRAFAYVSDRRTCWLKSSLGPVSANARVNLGVK